MKPVRRSLHLVFLLVTVLFIVPAAAGAARPFYAALSPNGLHDDDQTSLFYDPATGELAVDVPRGGNLTSINIDSAAGVFTGEPARNLGGSFDNDSDWNIFKATFGSSFGPISFGNVAQTGLSHDVLLADLTAVGSVLGGGSLGQVDLIYAGPVVPVLLPGDANQDWSFDQRDLVQVLAAGKYVSGRPATWGEGDWDGGPGGEPGNPPAGNGLFDEFDIMAALGRYVYETGPYRAMAANDPNMERLAAVQDVLRSLVSVDVPSGRGWNAMSGDLQAVGTLADGGQRSEISSIPVPEPQSVLSLAVGVVMAICHVRRVRASIS